MQLAANLPPLRLVVRGRSRIRVAESLARPQSLHRLEPPVRGRGDQRRAASGGEPWAQVGGSGEGDRDSETFEGISQGCPCEDLFGREQPSRCVCACQIKKRRYATVGGS